MTNQDKKTAILHENSTQSKNDDLMKKRLYFTPKTGIFIKKWYLDGNFNLKFDEFVRK